MTNPISNSLMYLAQYFKEHSIPYVIVGGVAVMITGRTRMTQDIDIILDHTIINRGNFLAFLQKNGFDATLSDFEGFDEKSHCTIFFKEGMFRIDIKGIYSELDQESIDMAIDEIFNGVHLKINHPLNTVAFKLKFGSEQDYEDALAVYIKNLEIINREELVKKASKMMIKNELKVFLKEVDEFLKEKME